MAKDASAAAVMDAGAETLTSPEPPRARERLAAAALLAFVAAAVLAFHWRAARPGWALAGPDVCDEFIALRDAVHASLRAGSFPLWQRGISLGYPLVGEPQSAVFDFATWLTLPWDAARSLTLGSLLHLVVMGWGMWFWMRARGLERIEALLAAVLFPLGVKQTVHLQHWNFAATTAWWPWMLGAVDALVAGGRRRWLALLAWSVAACWFGGAPQMAYFGMLLVGAWALRATPELWRSNRRAAAGLWLAIGAGLLIAMPAVLPAAELAQYGPRGDGLSYQEAVAFGWRDGWDASLLLLPHVFGHPGYWEGTNAWEAAGYLGVLPLAFAVAAPWRKRGLVLLAVTALLGVWLSYGPNGWLGVHHLAYRFLPGFALFRVPTRTLMVTSFCVAALAAEGLGALRRGGRRAHAACALVGLGAIAAALALAPGFPLDREAAKGDALLAVLLGSAGVGWLAVRPAGGRRWGWAAAAIGVVTVDLYLAAGAANPVAETTALRPQLTPLLSQVPGAPQPRRVAVTTDALINETIRVGLEGATGYGPMVVERVRRLIEATRFTGDSADMVVDPGRPRGDPTSPLWPFLATPVVVSSEPWALPFVASVRATSGTPLLVQRAPALPRVFWTGSFVQVSDEALGGWLRDAARGDRAIVADPPPFPSGPPSGPLPAEDVAVRDDSLEARVIAPRDGLAVVLDPWYPGWEATVDGDPAPVLRADYAFQAVPITAGVHRVVLRYRSRPLELGAALAAMGAALLAAVVVWQRRAAPRSREARGTRSASA